MNVLFVCNGNVARSQEAELFFNALKQDDSTATSAGINPKIGKPIDPLVIEVMNEIGYDISKATRKLVTEEAVRAADLAVSFKPADEIPEYLRNHKNIHYWNIPDPQHQSIEFHRNVRNSVQENVQRLIEELK
jgi:arsenate reductase